MKTLKSQRGVAMILELILVALVAGVISIAGYRWYQVKYGPETAISTSDGSKKLVSNPSSACSDKFDSKLILESAEFSNSGGVKKKYINYKVASPQAGIDILASEGYIVTEDLCKTTAINIPELKDVDNPGSGGSKVYASAGPGKVYIVIRTQVGDGSYIAIVDEEGKLISKDVVAEVTKVAPQGYYGFTFDSWKSATHFYVLVNGSTNYKVEVDAATGKTVGSAIKH